MLDNLMRRFSELLTRLLYADHKRVKRKYQGMKGGQDD